VPVFGVAPVEARRWISLGFILSARGVAKIAVVLYFARMICVLITKMRTFRLV
jgi:cell division protein FtsW (lipid II flippase)